MGLIMSKILKDRIVNGMNGIIGVNVVNGVKGVNGANTVNSVSTNKLRSSKNIQKFNVQWLLKTEN